MSSEKIISKLRESFLLHGCRWISSVLHLEGRKYESLFIYDNSYPDDELAENLLNIAEDILGKEKFHDLIVSFL